MPDETKQPQAWIGINDPHIQVRLKAFWTNDRPREIQADDLQLDAKDITEKFVTVDHRNKPRLSQNPDYQAACFELENITDTNAVADRLRALLIGLGYKIVKERFPV